MWANTLKFSDYGIEEAKRNGEFPLNPGSLNHICYYNDEFYIGEFSFYYSNNLSNILLAYYLSRKVDIENKDADYSVKFTELWLDYSSGEPVEIMRREMSYSDAKIRDYASMDNELRDEITLVNDMMIVPDDYLYTG